MLGKRHRVAVVGATGLVGEELCEIILARGHGFPDCFGRPRETQVCGRTVAIESMSPEVLAGYDVAFFCAPASIARELAPEVARHGVTVIDQSSAFRMDPKIPLVIPEVNPHHIHGKLIANPNCSTILLLLALAPLHREFGCTHVNVCTYQAISGAGKTAMGELIESTRGELEGSPQPAVSLHEEAAFNVWSHDSQIDVGNGYNVEEIKMIRESEKILEDPPRVTATCVRVPVLRTHCEAVSVTLGKPTAEARLREVLCNSPGVEIMDDRGANRFPTARKGVGHDGVLVGRIRPDLSEEMDASEGEQPRQYHFFLAGDQIRKGAALNAVQIADLMLS